MRRYNLWDGNPDGAPEIDRCVAEISIGFCLPQFLVQCSRKRGHGEDGLYCKQHVQKNHVSVPEDEDKENP